MEDTRRVLCADRGVQCRHPTNHQPIDATAGSTALGPSVDPVGRRIWAHRPTEPLGGLKHPTR